ncbi:hypothetical protein [Brevundimonas sp.]|uniref:hypothetical protein n=1 Tax=Brevundimonas sp. TaxID=1871086 RepID=UPI002D72156B|nr:hypothetical protein [Brevundimonas sp.]HYC99395.1 hypothetical protein [Brevundimonas sp.]
MRMRALLVLSGLAVSAAACATVEPPAATEPTPPPVTSGAPLPVEGHDWFYYADEETGRLVYGAAESDDLRLGFDCRRASGRLEVLTLAGKGAKPEIVVESGGDTGRFPARSEPSQLDDGVLLTADATTTEPVFQRFRRIGWIARWRDGEREAYAPHPASRPNIESFFAFCG